MPRHLAILFFLVVLVSSAGSAIAKNVDCLLEIDGKRYIDGQCDMSSVPGRGSFLLTSSPPNAKEYLALVEIAAGRATGYWNGDAGASRTHISLGAVKPSGACWTNARARICAWKIGEPRHFVDAPKASPPAADPSSDAPVPRRVGECVQTRIALLASRLEGDPDSGSAVAYANGIFGVSYETVEEVRHSRVGDKVTLCLVSEPGDCPKGDDRGKVYSAVNARTGEKWSLPDSAHMCGGA